MKIPSNLFVSSRGNFPNISNWKHRIFVGEISAWNVHSSYDSLMWCMGASVKSNPWMLAVIPQFNPSWPRPLDTVYNWSLLSCVTVWVTVVYLWWIHTYRIQLVSSGYSQEMLRNPSIWEDSWFFGTKTCWVHFSWGQTVIHELLHEDISSPLFPTFCKEAFSVYLPCLYRRKQTLVACYICVDTQHDFTFQSSLESLNTKVLSDSFQILLTLFFSYFSMCLLRNVASDFV